MGGREFEIIRDGSDAVPGDGDRAAVLAGSVMILPAVAPGSGPFQTRAMRWTSAPATDGERLVALSWYLALMTDICLGLIGARGPTIIEGPFARNPDYCAMLAALRPDGVEVAASATGTSVGAALLVLDHAAPPATMKIPRPDRAGVLLDYADRWRSALA